ncbi:MAG: ATP-binding cassette domain-containing protein [Candidatus Tectomicrobia bacterium]|nr:ATP-binding cassette domain-containing protein [Candidatus Tectomicrobia bacterium]
MTRAGEGLPEQSADAAPILALRNIRVAYESGQIALELAELDIHAGRVYAVVGPNGAGKSTLFKMLTRLVEPQQGHMQWHGQEVLPSAAIPPKVLRQHVVLVRQHPLLFRASVFHNVAYGLKLRGLSRRDIAQRVEAVLYRVQMSEFAKRPARQLSGGETQRVALAQALALQPEVLLLDEPTANLDAQSAYIVETLIQELRQQRERTILLTTHDMAQAYRLSDDIIALEQGRLVTRSPENILRGNLVKRDDITCFDTGRLAVVIPDHYRTASCIAIAPDDIVLSSLPLSSSARNNFVGQVVQVSALGPQLVILVDIGELLYARITRHSYDLLGLTIGGTVYVTFKASAVCIYA